MLRAAHEFMGTGRYAEATMAFQQLARTAEERFPERAPMLCLQAGRAAILDEQAQIGVSHLCRGLTILASQGRYARMQMLVSVRRMNLTDAACMPKQKKSPACLRATCLSRTRPRRSLPPKRRCFQLIVLHAAQR